MKKVLFFALFSVAMIYACTKKNDAVKQPEKPLVTAVVKSSDLVDVKGTDILTTGNVIKRQIDIVNKSNNSVYKTFTITLTSNKDGDITESLKQHTFSGSFSVSSDNVVLLTGNADNGSPKKLDRVYIKNGKAINVAEASADCGVGTVHDCVSYKIEAMNWIDYGVCLATAPACYSQLWASCTWDVCVQGKTYVNPVN